MINQSEGEYDLGDRLAIPDIDLPEDYREDEKWQGLVSSLTDLYMDYRRGMPKVEVLPSTVPTATPPVHVSQELVDPTDVQTEPAATSSLVHGTSRVSLGHMDPTDTQAPAAMSKTQYQLTVEEGKLWEKLTDPEEASDHDDPTETILTSLREKSGFMVQSLVRRSTPPTGITYEESKTILHAMGVPCIDTIGPYEAEALASSLVLNGCADYVASEDTVRRGAQPLSCPSLTKLFSVGCADLWGTSSSQHHKQRKTPLAYFRLRGADCAPSRRRGLR